MDLEYRWGHTVTLTNYTIWGLGFTLTNELLLLFQFTKLLPSFLLCMAKEVDQGHDEEQLGCAWVDMSDMS